jgi:hypothetical protein
MKMLIYVGLILGTLFIFPTLSLADDIIQGHYCYTYGDNESLREARELTKSLAIRNAIESYRVFITSASTVKNFQLTNDLVQIISSGYLKNLEVIEHKEEGRTICETIQAIISPDAVENIIKKEIRERIKGTEEIGLANNGFLKILNIRKGGNPYSFSWPPAKEAVFVTLKVLKRTGSLYPDYERKQKPYFRICIDFYDSEGNPIGGDSNFVHQNHTEMIAGQIKTTVFPIPKDAQSWKVWLPGE